MKKKIIYRNQLKNIYEKVKAYNKSFPKTSYFWQKEEFNTSFWKHPISDSKIRHFVHWNFHSIQIACVHNDITFDSCWHSIRYSDICVAEHDSIVSWPRKNKTYLVFKYSLVKVELQYSNPIKGCRGQRMCS